MSRPSKKKGVVATGGKADPEGFAMLVISEVMAPLDQYAAARIRDWINDRFHTGKIAHGLNMQLLEETFTQKQEIDRLKVLLYGPSKKGKS